MWYGYRNVIGAAKRRVGICCAFAAVVLAAAVPTLLHAQQEDALSLTVTPPLFQLALSPGETWASAITVVNANPYDLTVYAHAVNFAARGERGGGKFLPVVGTSTPAPPASWIDITQKPIVIAREQTASVPFTVTVPEDAAPGGHYGAILIGNRPEAGGEGATLLVSSSVASLLFFNIAGDIVEDGLIREFSTPQSIYQKPEVPFTLRFQNRGNVHVQPQGSIVIYNMWGKERGRIDINQRSQFGNVLPDSIRTFNFTWEGEDNAYEIGRYKAVATLAYGSDARQNVGRVTYFWVLPVTTALYTALGVLLFGGLLVWAVRTYIRRALALEAQRLRAGSAEAPQSYASPQSPAEAPKQHAPPSVGLGTFIRPLERGVVDLRRVRFGQEASPHTPAPPTPSYEAASLGEGERAALSPREFFKKYAWFFILVLLLAFAAHFVSMYFEEVLTYERDYEIHINDGQLSAPDAPAQ